MSVKNSEGERIYLEHRSPSFGSLIIVIPQAPDGSTKPAAIYLREKPESSEDKLRTGYLLQKEAWLCLNTTIRRALVWPLSASNLSASKYRHILVPVLLTYLTSSGFHRYLPISVVHGPKEDHRLDIPDIYIHQRT